MPKTIKSNLVFQIFIAISIGFVIILLGKIGLDSITYFEYKLHARRYVCIDNRRYLVSDLIAIGVNEPCELTDSKINKE